MSTVKETLEQHDLAERFLKSCNMVDINYERYSLYDLENMVDSMLEDKIFRWSWKTLSNYDNSRP